jgi:hypothetical protein
MEVMAFVGLRRGCFVEMTFVGENGVFAGWGICMITGGKLLVVAVVD